MFTHILIFISAFNYCHYVHTM